MPYDSDDDYDYSDEDDGFPANVKYENDYAPRPPTHSQISSKFPPPTKLWPYDYIVGEWKDFLSANAASPTRVKGFLSEIALVNGSEYGDKHTRWSGRHEFWEATLEATGQRVIFFSGDAIDELVGMLHEQVDQIAKSVFRPDPNKSITVKTGIEPKSLKPRRPVDVQELLSMLEDVKGDFFSLILTQSRQAWKIIQNTGGSAISIKTQRYEGSESVVLEIGFATLKIAYKDGVKKDEDHIAHFIVEENENYANGKIFGDNRKNFGFGETVKIPEDDIIKRLEQEISALSDAGPVMLVFHGGRPELEYLEKQEMPMDNWMPSFPPSISQKIQPADKKKPAKYPVIIQDTQRLFAAFTANPQFAQVSLTKACREVKVPNMYHNHNAGNDAYYLLQLYERLMVASISYQL